MKIYKLYRIDGFSGDSYYCIPNEITLGYYVSREKAEAHPEYQLWLKKEQEQNKLYEKIKGLSDEQIENTLSSEELDILNENDSYHSEPNYVGIIEIDVID